MPVTDAGGPPADLLTVHHEAAHGVVALALSLPLSQITRGVWGMAGTAALDTPTDYSHEAYPPQSHVARRSFFLPVSRPKSDSRASSISRALAATSGRYTE